MSNRKKINSQILGSFLMFIIPIILGIIYYKQLPNEMAVHFNNQNVADGFAPKWFALFALPLFMILVHGFSLFVIQNDPKKDGHSKVVKRIMYWFIPVLTIFMEINLIAYGLDKAFNITTYVLVGLGIFTMILGNYLPKSRQNFSVGIKLPWTLSSEENWNRTHLMAGKVWLVSGLLMILLVILGYPNMVIVIVFAMAIIPTIYSYRLYKKSQRQ